VSEEKKGRGKKRNCCGGIEKGFLGNGRKKTLIRGGHRRVRGSKGGIKRSLACGAPPTNIARTRRWASGEALKGENPWGGGRNAHGSEGKNMITLHPYWTVSKVVVCAYGKEM